MDCAQLVCRLLNRSPTKRSNKLKVSSLELIRGTSSLRAKSEIIKCVYMYCIYRITPMHMHLNLKKLNSKLFHKQKLKSFQFPL